MPASGQWRLGRRIALHWRQLDGDWLVFEAGSGDTHQLDAISAAVLMCLEAEPHDLRGLSQAIATELRVGNPDDLAPQIARLLDQFSQLGLVEPVSS